MTTNNSQTSVQHDPKSCVLYRQMISTRFDTGLMHANAFNSSSCSPTLILQANKPTELQGKAVKEHDEVSSHI